MSNEEIAQAPFVPVKTVDVHLSSAYCKLGIGSRRELAGALGEHTSDAPSRSATAHRASRGRQIAPTNASGGAAAEFWQGED